MKKRTICGLLAAVCLLCGIRAAAASGSEESLVSVSYLTGTFLPALESLLQSRAKEDTQAVYDQALARLDGIGGSYTGGLTPPAETGGWTYSDTPQVRGVKRGDVLTVSTGSTILWTGGMATAGTSGLVDATAGTELAQGGRLTAGHRYLNGAEGGGIAVTVLSDAGSALMEGNWTLAESFESVTPFTDLVQSKDWFYDAVRYAVDRGMFNGVSATQFSPNAAMDRSMLATVLYRLEGSPTGAYTGIFTDVADGQWYTAGIEWAAASGIVNGVGNDRFAPARSVTREQIASMLYRYARDYLRLDVSQTGDLSVFTDSGQVSDWAVEGMTWAVGAGIITGSDFDRLLPVNNATRAQVATMLQRFESWAGRGGDDVAIF